MKEYLFAMQVVKNDGKVHIVSHAEQLASDADAMERARKVLEHARKDKVNVLQIDLFGMCRKHIVSYK